MVVSRFSISSLLFASVHLVAGFHTNLKSARWKSSALYSQPVRDDFGFATVATSRRDWIRDSIQQASSLVLASLITGQPLIARAEETLNIVITGANSGIGFEACKRLAALGHTIVLACRTKEKAQEAIRRLPPGSSSIAAECDLANSKSIEQFVKQLPTLLGNGKIDRLCLNAGLCRNTAATDCARTVDGFELTVGTNYFGHFLLNSLALPMVKEDGRIIITASSVHDPESPGGAQGVPATLGELKGLSEQGRNCEMINGEKFNADKAYKDSKVRRCL
jgi:protochlorophyllide reductase